MKPGRRRVPDQNRQFARDMRADSTKAENMLWQVVRNKQLEGFKFKRQVPIENYIVDFVCFEARLVIELDGSQHIENKRGRWPLSPLSHWTSSPLRRRTADLRRQER